MPESPILVLITGANSGLGFAAARELASSGRFHVLVGARSLEKAEDAIERMLSDESFPVTRSAVTPLLVDLNDDASVSAAAETVRDGFGALDLLINCAGVFAAPTGRPLREQFQAVFDTNLFGAAVLLDAFLPLLRASTHSDRRIVNVTSGAGQIGLALSADPRFNALAIAAPPYRTSKAALNMLTAIYAMQLAEEGITCVVAAPGPTQTRLSTGTGGKDVHDGVRPILRAATAGVPSEVNGTLVADESTEYGW